MKRGCIILALVLALAAPCLGEGMDAEAFLNAQRIDRALESFDSLTSVAVSRGEDGRVTDCRTRWYAMAADGSVAVATLDMDGRASYSERGVTYAEDPASGEMTAYLYATRAAYDAALAGWCSELALLPMSEDSLPVDQGDGTSLIVGTSGDGAYWEMMRVDTATGRMLSLSVCARSADGQGVEVGTVTVEPNQPCVMPEARMKQIRRPARELTVVSADGGARIVNVSSAVPIALLGGGEGDPALFADAALTRRISRIEPGDGDLTLYIGVPAGVALAE